MSKSTKVTPWLNLAAGLLWLLSVARDIWMPGVLSISGNRHGGDYALLQLATAVLLLFAACRGFMRMRCDSTR